VLPSEVSLWARSLECYNDLELGTAALPI
jgi:hypothetical protein